MTFPLLLRKSENTHTKNHIQWRYVHRIIHGSVIVLDYLELEVLRVKIPLKDNTGFPFIVK